MGNSQHRFRRKPVEFLICSIHSPLKALRTVVRRRPLSLPPGSQKAQIDDWWVIDLSYITIFLEYILYLCMQFVVCHYGMKSNMLTRFLNHLLTKE